MNLIDCINHNGNVIEISSPLWLHHVICGAPLSKAYTFKIDESDMNRWHVIARTKTIDLYFYPKDRTNRSECEQIIESLKRDLEALP